MPVLQANVKNYWAATGWAGGQFPFALCHKNLTKALRLASPTPTTHQPHMIPHLHRHIPHPCQPQLATSRRFPNRQNRKSFLIPLAALFAVLALSSCSEREPAPAPPPVSVDTVPVGEGLKLIGFAMLGAACVLVLGKLIR